MATIPESGIYALKTVLFPNSLTTSILLFLGILLALLIFICWVCDRTCCVQARKCCSIFCGLCGILFAGFILAIVVAVSYSYASHITVLPSITLHLVGCAFLRFFDKTVHPWRNLSEERQRRRWGRLQGTKKGIVAEPTIWDQVSKRWSSLAFNLKLATPIFSTEKKIELQPNKPVNV